MRTENKPCSYLNMHVSAQWRISSRVHSFQAANDAVFSSHSQKQTGNKILRN